MSELRNKLIERINEKIDPNIFDINVEKNDTKEENQFVQWEERFNGYYPTTKTIPDIPTGIYKVLFDANSREFFLKKKKIYTDELIFLPYPEFEEILKDIGNFWELKEEYKKLKYIYKRAYLLYGAPGTGKTSLVNFLLKKLKEFYNGVIIDVEKTNEIGGVKKMVEKILEITPDKKIIISIEDIDNFLNAGSYPDYTSLLSLIDGRDSMENVVVIATTNYPEKLEKRLTNRPGRFARLFQIGYPTEEIRKIFIKHKLQNESEEIIDEIINKTDGLILDHIREVILQTKIYKRNIDEVVGEIRKNTSTIKIEKNESFGL
jgi:SpoVK/Ycf46/Vps4 family AAA+-type ATPase